MSIKKEVSKSVVFASVFAGTLISEGISLVTISEPGKKLAGRIKQTVGNIREDVHDRYHLMTARVIEESALINAKIRRGSAVRLIQEAQHSFRESYATAKARYATRA